MSKKVLVVDDEAQIVKVLKAYLEQSGFQVIPAADGKAALTVFQREKPDFIILDLNLPVCWLLKSSARICIAKQIERVTLIEYHAVLPSPCSAMGSA